MSTAILGFFLSASLCLASAPPTPRRHQIPTPPSKLTLIPAGGKGTVRVYSGTKLIEVESIEGGKPLTLLPPPGVRLRLVIGKGDSWLPLPLRK